MTWSFYSIYVGELLSVLIYYYLIAAALQESQTDFYYCYSYYYSSPVLPSGYCWTEYCLSLIHISEPTRPY